MIQEFAYLNDIEVNLDSMFGIEIRHQSEFLTGPIDRIISGKISEYKSTLDNLSVNELSQTKDARESELQNHYMKALQYRRGQNSRAPVDQKRIQVLHDLVRAYIGISAVKYAENGIGFMQSFIVGLDNNEIARMAELLNMDLNTFKQRIVPSKRDTKLGITPLQTDYSLERDYPGYTGFFSRLVQKGILGTDYSLPNKRGRGCTAAIISFVLGKELNISKQHKYFEQYWGLKNLDVSLDQVKKRKNKGKTRDVLDAIFDDGRSSVSDIQIKNEKVNGYLNQM